MTKDKKANEATLREWFAGQALVGLIQNQDIGIGSHVEITSAAVTLADALIAELETRG